MKEWRLKARRRGEGRRQWPWENSPDIDTDKHNIDSSRSLLVFSTPPLSSLSPQSAISNHISIIIIITLSAMSRRYQILLSCPLLQGSQFLFFTSFIHIHILWFILNLATPFIHPLCNACATAPSQYSYFSLFLSSLHFRIPNLANPL